MQETILISLPIKDLQAIIVECVNSCLKYHTPNESADTNQNIPDQNFTVQQLADYWQCHPQTIMKQKRAGLISFHQSGRKLFFKKSEIDKITAVPSIRSKRK